MIPTPPRRAALLCALLLASGCGHEGVSGPPGVIEAEATIHTRHRTIHLFGLFVAQKRIARAEGLSGVSQLGPNRGMVFVWRNPVDAAFTMKKTRIPLSVASWGPDRRILAILDMEPCRRDPCPLHRPGRGFVGALEMHRGWFERHGVRVGDRIEVQLLRY